MEHMSIFFCKFGVKPVTAILLLAVTMPFSPAVTTDQGDRLSGTGWERYQIILDREPFGKSPPGGADAAGAAGAAGAGGADGIDEGPGLHETVQLSLVTSFEGTPAAGFTDSSTGKSYYLFEGETHGEFTLLRVDARGGTINLKKGEQEALLSIDGNSSPAPAPEVAAGTGAARPVNDPVAPAVRSPAPGRGAAATPGGTVSYAEMQRRRVAEARARMEEARRTQEAARMSQEETVARKTEEAVTRRLRDLNLEMIKSGHSAAMPMELTPQEVEQLAAEGFDVTAPADKTAQQAETEAEQEFPE